MTISIVFLLALCVLFVTVAGNKANKGNPQNARITFYFALFDTLLWIWLAYLLYHY